MCVLRAWWVPCVFLICGKVWKIIRIFSVNYRILFLYHFFIIFNLMNYIILKRISLTLYQLSIKFYLKSFNYCELVMMKEFQTK